MERLTEVERLAGAMHDADAAVPSACIRHRWSELPPTDGHAVLAMEEAAQAMQAYVGMGIAYVKHLRMLRASPGLTVRQRARIGAAYEHFKAKVG